MKRKKTILIDMDNILVDMLPQWLKQYNEITGEQIEVNQLQTYDMLKEVGQPNVLMSILEKQGFFRSLPIILGAYGCINKLIKEGHEVVIVTQPPRASDYALKEKRLWIGSYFPNFDMQNIIFAHKKYLVRGDILFDDSPIHLEKWKEYNPKGKTAKILYNFNRLTKTDFSQLKECAWEDFYDFVNEIK